MRDRETSDSLNPYEDSRYARGFLLASSDHPVPRHDWTHVALGMWGLSHDPRVRIGLARDGERWAVILGRVVDLDSATSDNRTIARTLLARAASPASHYDYLDSLSGRYLIAWGTATCGTVTADAGGVRSVFYMAPPGPTIVSSHAELVATTAGASPSQYADPDWGANHGVYYLPGDATPYAGVRFLTPNLELDLRTNRTRRYYPREPIAAKSVPQAAKALANLLNVQLKVLAEDSDFVVSLSAGIDSRATLAVMQPFIAQTTFFTYYITGTDGAREVSLWIDREVSREIASNLNLSHMVLDLDGSRVSQDLQDVLRSNTFVVHSRLLAAAYMEHFSADALHLRSNLVEIGRAFYRNAGASELPLTPERMASTYGSTRLAEPQIVAEFDDWARRAQFEDAHGLDPYDLFYWEHRMGTWHSGVVLESDAALDTFILFNSRRVLELLLSVPMADRLQGSVLRDLITREWPILDFWPVNVIRSTNHRFDPEFDEEGVDLGAGTVKGGSLDPNRHVLVATEVSKHRVKFWMTASAPRLGDFAEYRIPLATIPKEGYTIGLAVRSPYSNDRVPRRLEYEVLVDGQTILREDVSSWGETNAVRIWCRATGSVTDLVVRVVALRDCEHWSWGRSGRILISGLTIAELPEATTTKAVATSPSSVLCVPSERMKLAPLPESTDRPSQPHS